MLSFATVAKTIRTYFNRNTPEPDFAFTAGALINSKGVVGAKVDASGNLVFTGDQLASVGDALTAHSGGGQGSGTALAKQINRFSTVAAPGDSALLPAAAAGLEITVINSTSTSMNVFPATGDAINALSANAAFAVLGNTAVTFYSTAAGLWSTSGASTVTGTGAAVRATSPTLVTPALGVATATSVAATGALTSNSPSAGIGYATGAGVAAAQSSSRTTTVAANGLSGTITLVSAAGSATPATFTFTNTSIGANDVVHVTQKSGTDKYEIFVTATGSGTCNITSFTTGGTTTEQPVFNFVVIKGVAS